MKNASVIRNENPELAEIANKIGTVTEAEKLYLNPEITLLNLSESLEIKPTEASQALNQILGKNFFDFINQLRISHTCELLKNHSPKEKNITEIMYESGLAQNHPLIRLLKSMWGKRPVSTVGKLVD